MSEKIVQLNEAVIKSELKELVRGSVEETLNELLETEAQKLTQAARYERNEQRQGYRSGHYSRNLTTTSGDVTLKGDNPKFCVTAKSGANREKFIMGGRRVKRLPPCLQHNASGTGCQGGAIISPQPSI